jgi:hypothetical protein
MRVTPASNALLLLLSLTAPLLATACTSRVGAGEIDPVGAGPGAPGLGVVGKYPVVEALELTMDQRRAWKEAWHDQGAVVRPAVARGRDLRLRLQRELESESPDPVTVGNYVIALDQIAGTLGEARTDLDRALTRPLDDDQRSKLETLRTRLRENREASARPRPWLERGGDSYNAYKQFSSP